MKKSHYGLIVLAVLLILLPVRSNMAYEIHIETASVNIENTVSLVLDTTTPPALEIDPEPETDPIFPNEVGEIMIIMYHGLHEYAPGPYDRLTSDFWNDLQTLYDHGYRLITMRDLVNNNITTPAGYTPVVLSFDDGAPSAFSLIMDDDGVLSPTPGSAVYLINKFYEKNPDFGRTAIFFINGHPEPFRGEGTMEERFAYLIDNGFELGNHGFYHANFALFGDRNAQGLQREVGRMDQFIRRYAPDYDPIVIAYPFGIRPRPRLRNYVMQGEYDGVEYRHLWALRVGNTGVPAVPHHINFDPTNVSRVVASDVSTYYRVVPDLGHLLRFFERNPHLRFISDGDPYTITVPSHLAHYVNMYALGDKILVVYDKYEKNEEPEYTTNDYEEDARIYMAG